MYLAPGVYREDIFPQPPVSLRTGVAAFLGISHTHNATGQEIPPNQPRPLTLWSQFEQYFGKLLSSSYLGYAVRGFFQNGGRLCYVVRLKNATHAALESGLKALESLNTIDLVCAPDIMWLPPSETDPQEVQLMQSALLRHCHTLGNRFAILDSLPGADLQQIKQQRQGLIDTYGALYYPWIRLSDGPVESGYLVPPCGHVAGVYTRCDERIGVYKAPANEILEGVVSLELALTNAQQGELNPEGINCLRAFPGRGIRVWGARTLSPESNWRYINVRRLFLTVGRWIELNMANRVFEPNDTKLWAIIRRDLTAYFNGLFQQGALKGSSPGEAFIIKCDEETNPPEITDAGKVVTEIALAPAVPGEFIIVRIIHGMNGITISEPTI
jgi:phage tail sheath protein FI